MAFDFFNFDAGKVLPALWETYQTGKARKQYRKDIQPLQDFYSAMLPQLQAHYDPETARRGIRQAAERETGLLRDLWSEQDLKRDVFEKRYGTGGATPTMLADDKRAGIRAGLLSDAMNRASSGYYAQPAGLFSGIQNVGKVYSGQPLFTSAYQEAQQSPWGTALDALLFKSL